MNGEVQLIVNNSVPTNILSESNDPTLMGIGVLSRMVVVSRPEIASWVNTAITIYNAAGDSVTKTLNTIVVDSPSPGYTRLNFAGSWSNDYSQAAGGYFVQPIGSAFYLDLFENESISQNWKFQDLSNFTAQGAFSREFRIPFSQNNKEAIGALFDNNVEQGAQNYFFYKLPAEIRVDTLPIATGYLRVRKVYKQMNRINEVEVAFYAETPDLVRTIGEKKLSDIAALTDLNEAVNYANVTTETADRIWTLCDRGQLWSNDGSEGSRPILSSTNYLAAFDLTPAVSWWYLLRNIITEAGFDLVASSLENIIEDYYMPFCNTPQLNTFVDTNNYFFLAYNPADIVFNCNPQGSTSFALTAELFDNNGDFNTATGEYTVPYTATYIFSGLVNFFRSASTGLSNSARGRISLLKNGVVTSVRDTPVFTSNTVYSFQFSEPLLAGDVISFTLSGTSLWTTNGVSVNNGSCTITTLFADGQLFKPHIKLDSILNTNGPTIDYALNAPDMRQIDFVNDVIKMHNCAIVPSRIVPNRIAIVPQNSYLGTGDVVDWTAKLDISKDIVVSSTVDIQKATFQFTYTSGEDAYSKLYRNANRVYGDFKSEGYTINPSTSPSDFAIGDQKITLVTRSAPAAFIPGTNTPIQCFYNDQLEFVAPGPRALFNAGTIEVILFNESTGLPVTTEVPILNHYSNAYPTLTDNDLNWAPEVPPHNITVISNPLNNLFNAYWRDYMNALYSPEGRIMEAFFALDVKDILTFSFADRIWIQDAYWRILEITDYKIGYNESTKVKLLKYLDPVEDCASTPVGITANGEVEFESGGEAVEPTEDCCSRYGYFWDEINGVCWAFNNGGQFRNSILPNTPAINPAFSSVLNSFVNGVKISIEAGNSNMLAVGQDLNLTKFVDGSNLLGKNVETNLPGLHLGGGYRAGSPANTETGWSQSGIVHFHRKTGYNAIGATAELYIEGLTGEHLEIGDSSTMSCMLNLTLQDELQTDIDVAILSFGLTKVGGNAYATPVTVISNDTFGTGYTYDISIDTLTNTAQHRIVLTINGAPSFPITLIATASLHYQQNKLI